MMPQAGWNPRRSAQVLWLLAVILVVVSVAEFGVMLIALPLLLPGSEPDYLEAVIDSCVLSVLIAPVLWFVLIQPLNVTAAGERSRAESIVATAADGILIVDRRGRIQSVNPSAQRIFRQPLEELIGRELPELLGGGVALELSRLTAPGPVPAGPENWHERTRSGIETAGRLPDGHTVPLAVSLSAFQSGSEVLITAIIRDLTVQKQAERLIRNREQQQSAVARLGQQALAGRSLESLFDDSVRTICETLDVAAAFVLQFDRDREQLIIRAVESVDGPVAEELPGGRIRLPAAQTDECLPSDDQPVVFRTPEELPCPVLRAWLESHRFRSGAVVAIPGEDVPFGLLLIVEGRAGDLTPVDGQFLVSVANVAATALARARSEHERTEVERVRAGQMAVIAQIATGVAHEIRNPLTSIKLLVQTLRETWRNSVLSSAESAEDFEVIESEIRRMEQSLETFLAFARPSAPKMQQVRLADVLDRTVRLIDGRARRQGVTIRVDAGPPELSVHVDPAQIQQVLLNLSLNALDAMPGGGTLSLTLVEADNGWVELHVRDTGPGVAPEVVERLFEPFLTTRETGVGIGLVICRQIAASHGGQLILRPVDSGACFVLRLPPRHDEDSTSHAETAGH